jgi:hypothetical protein
VFLEMTKGAIAAAMDARSLTAHSSLPSINITLTHQACSSAPRSRSLTPGGRTRTRAAVSFLQRTVLVRINAVVLRHPVAFSTLWRSTAHAYPRHRLMLYAQPARARGPHKTTVCKRRITRVELLQALRTLRHRLAFPVRRLPYYASQLRCLHTPAQRNETLFLILFLPLAKRHTAGQPLAPLRSRSFTRLSIQS